MERVFAMPDLGEGLEEGRVVAWLVAVGDEVLLNQPLADVETAKAAVELPSPYRGRVVALHSDAGVDVPVGAPLVTFEVEDRTTPVRTTPPVRKLARELGLDLAAVSGTGPDGRITEEDVRRAGGGPGDPPLVATAMAEDLGSRLEPVSPIRREIAETLTKQSTVPQVTTFRTVDCSALEAFRRSLGVSPLPVIIAALCRVAAEHPILIARWLDDMIEYRAAINVGIAVDTAEGLLVPVVRDAGHRGIAALADDIARLAEGARSGTLAFDERVATATIAVSNTGSYGSEAGTPILSPGTSVTLAFGVIAPRALVVEEHVVARPAATISLTFDHRVLDGAAAGRALGELVALLESPERLGELPR